MQNLRRKPTYNELINYLEFEQPKIKYPDRRATFLRNSPYLSQFDGDSWIDLEEQEQNINKEKLKEMEVQKVSKETQATAQLERIKQRIQGIKRTTMQLKQSQANRRANRGMYVDITKGGDTPITQMFDMTVDDATDAAMADAEAAEQEARTQAQSNLQNILSKVSRSLQENDVDMPYLNTDLPAEDTSNPRGRPPNPNKPIKDDGTEDTTQQRRTRTRSPQNERVVKSDKEKTKRSQSTTPTTPPKSKKSKEQLSKEMKQMEEDVNSITIKQEPKAKAKSTARSSNDKSDDDVEITDVKPNKNKSMKFWKEQSANELRAQLKLRDRKRFEDEWAFKNRDQLLDIIQELIKKKQW